MSRRMSGYQVGKPLDTKPNDPICHDLQNAIDYAADWHRNGCKGREPVAVWDEDDEYVVLFFDGQQFRRT